MLLSIAAGVHLCMLSAHPLGAFCVVHASLCTHPASTSCRFTSLFHIVVLLHASSYIHMLDAALLWLGYTTMSRPVPLRILAQGERWLSMHGIMVVVILP